MFQGNQEFYLKQEEPNKSCFLALREIILNSDQSISETKKYGMPCFCYGKKAICYLWTDKITTIPYILFVDGNKLDFQELKARTRKRMKVLNVNPNEDIELELVNLIIKEAIELVRQ